MQKEKKKKMKQQIRKKKSQPSGMLNAEMPIHKNAVQMAMRFTLAEAPKAFSNRIAYK